MYERIKTKKYNIILEDSIMDNGVFIDHIIEATEKIIKRKYGKEKISIYNLKFLKKNSIYIMKTEMKNERKINLGTRVLSKTIFVKNRQLNNTPIENRITGNLLNLSFFILA